MIDRLAFDFRHGLDWCSIQRERLRKLVEGKCAFLGMVLLLHVSDGVACSEGELLSSAAEVSEHLIGVETDAGTADTS
eukprot:SAG31_NODE_27591_length_423_cov_1.274691_1_plen_77_part_10